MAKIQHPTVKLLRKVLDIHGLTDEEKYGITVLDNEENDRVGYAWKGYKVTEAMKDIEETLKIKDIVIRFQKVDDYKGIIYVNMKN
jgi:hypothetical protein